MNKEQCKKEFSKGMKGWDFTYLKGRTEEDSLPWGYGEIIIDMGTGGGELL